MAEVVISSGKQFEVAQDESILDAALRQGIVLEYSCRTGRCGTCRAVVRAGTTFALRDETGLDEGERGTGWILTCVRGAASHVSLDVEDLAGLGLHPVRTLPCRIHSLERLSTDILRIELRLPSDAAFGYRPGQYIDVIGRGGLKRSYSIANAPRPSGLLELHVRRVDGGAMSDYWFDHAKANDLLRLRGPMGTCVLRDVAGRSLVFFATGTGLAPIKAMIESLALVDAQNRPRSISLYWGGRVRQDIYWSPENIGQDCHFVPVLSRSDADWRGARGYVQDVFLQAGADLGDSIVYACGSDAMIHSARRQLLHAGLSLRGFHSDAFVASGESSLPHGVVA